MTDPGEATQETPQSVAVPETSPEAQEQAESILRQARLAKIRGNRTESDELLQAAIAAAPHSAEVLEAVGDDYAERKQMKKAMETYAMAVAAAPGNIGIERKHAESVLAVKGIVDPFTMLEQADSGTMASGKAAMVLSIFLPGVGQMVTGHVTKGIFMLSGVVLGWVITLSLPNGFSELLKSLSRPANPNPLIFVTMPIAVGCHLWSMFDAASTAKRFTPKKIVRPTPLSDRDHEL